ncbi:sugar isomerase [Rhizobium sp. P38BS-XIX]|uniref:SIS domain-containing protein n=1 Tax=Rhizobium sp. P38BS-XIX TaxID=2726740 RepID=UPI0014578F90|nr:sugar isomerase [Rhizobium sp. P38BS-XIX]NLS00760.1 sugar isomerase [Rhizobium sp. P38BS-XIX]
MANERIGYRSAVARQPESLAQGLETVAHALQSIDVAPFRGKSIGFAGIGASYQAAMVGAIYLRSLGISSFPYCPTDLYQAVDSAAEAFVALSASGQSKEISDVMALRSHLPRLAICRSAGNPLAELVGAVIPSASGADNGASSTGYTGMVLAIGLLCDAIAGKTFDGWAKLPSAVRQTLQSALDSVRVAAASLQSCVEIDLVGAGAGFATAGEGAMLIREAVRVPAAGWDTLNYLHGPMESQDARTGVISFGNGREVKIAQDMAGFGCPSVLITNRDDVPAVSGLTVITVPGFDNPAADAIIQIVALQMIVSDMQDAAGLTDITFRYRQTDTKLKPWSATEV